MILKILLKLFKEELNMFIMSKNFIKLSREEELKVARFFEEEFGITEIMEIQAKPLDFNITTLVKTENK
jgi:hypothetical protein